MRPCAQVLEPVWIVALYAAEELVHAMSAVMWVDLTNDELITKFGALVLLCPNTNSNMALD